MKRNIIAIVAFLAGMPALAQYVPDRLNYQAILTDHQGNPQAGVTNIVRFRIYDEPAGGNLVWGETHSVTTSPRGLFSVILGAGSSLGEYTTAASLREAFASATLVQQRYLEMQPVRSDGTAQSPILPRQRFLTIPYAFQANDGQASSGDFTVSGALYASHTGMKAGKLIMTNSQPLNVAGSLRLDGTTKPSVTANFGGASSVRSTAADALKVNGSLTVNQVMTVTGAGVFNHRVTAVNPTFKKGITAKRGMRVLGGYTCVASNVTVMAARTAPGDGFALVYFRTTGWGDSDDLVVTVQTNEFRLKHQPATDSASKNGFNFSETVCIPIGKGAVWSATFSGTDHSHSKFDMYWIPFGY